MDLSIKDPLFGVEVLSKTPNPQQLIWAAMHQDYSEGFVWEDRDNWPSEKESGELIVKHLLKGGRGHYGPLEHPQIAFNCGYFPHGSMQQLRTHRNISFDVESGRYTGDRIVKYVEGSPDKPAYTQDLKELEKLFYLRPVGTYTDRKGGKYEYTHEMRSKHLQRCVVAAYEYRMDIKAGLSEEHARGLIPFDFRQHWVMSGNARAIMHLMDVRAKLDVQPEARTCIEMIFEHFKEWVPAVGQWYEENRWRKGRLAP